MSHQSFNMGNEAMEGSDLDRTQKTVPSSIRGRGAVKTRKEKKAGVMNSEAQQRTQAALGRICDENADPNTST